MLTACACGREGECSLCLDQSRMPCISPPLRAGIEFAGVHDSYWTHAGTVDGMSRILREQARNCGFFVLRCVHRIMTRTLPLPLRSLSSSTASRCCSSCITTSSSSTRASHFRRRHRLARSTLKMCSAANTSSRNEHHHKTKCPAPAVTSPAGTSSRPLVTRVSSPRVTRALSTAVLPAARGGCSQSCVRKRESESSSAPSHAGHAS